MKGQKFNIPIKFISDILMLPRKIPQKHFKQTNKWQKAAKDIKGVL